MISSNKLQILAAPLRNSSTPLSSLLPQNPNGHNLITSRSKTAANNLTGSDKTVIEVEPMSETESVELFLKYCQGKSDQYDANQITQNLGFLPLAIVQSARYLNERAPRLTAKAFLEDLQEHHDKLFKSDTSDSAGTWSYDTMIDSVKLLSFERITLSARRLLTLMSLCNPDKIPDYLVRNLHEKGNVLSQRTLNSEFGEDISCLVDFSLVKIDHTGHFFSVHRLVQYGVRDFWSSVKLTEWKNEYIMTLSASYPEDMSKEWPKCEQLAPHIDASLAYRPVDERYLGYWTSIVSYAADYAVATGSFVRAEELHSQALEELQKTLGPEHPKTMKSIASLGLVHIELAKYQTAEDLTRRALEGREKALGLDHPDTVVSYSRLGLLLQKQGNYVKAERIHRHTLKSRIKLLGPEHPDTLASSNSLALVLGEQGKHEEARELNQRTPRACEKVLGTEHTLTLNSVYNLAQILQH